jgi:Cu/Ag efflux protein CusF
MRKTMRKLGSRTTTALCALLLVACGAQQQGDESTTSEPQEFAFAGTVERVDPVARTVTVRNEDIPGWMMSMSMNYVLDRPELVDSLTAGDRITATVYGGEFGTLHEVTVVRPQ